jgi:hypothetical protein
MQNFLPETYPETENRVFSYLDAMPGSGKTEYFVNKAVALLADKKPDHNLLYAAPTVRLLIEATRRIRNHKDFNAKDKRRIVLVATHSKVSELKGLCQTYAERPVKVINHLLGLSKEDPTIEPLGVGNVILVTHECFVQVAVRDLTGGQFEVLKRTSVIFDEARQCVIESRTTKDLSYGDLAVMSRLFRFKRQQVNEKKNPGWFVYEVQRAPTHKALLDGFHTKRVRAIPSSIHKLRDEVSRYSDTGRSKVYFMTNMDNAYTFLDDDERHATAVITTLLRPTSLFNNYRDVTLTSAFFKDSQLYHFLKQDGHKFKNLAKTNPEGVASIIKRDSLLRQHLPSRLLVAPLMVAPENTKTSDRYRNTLTANLLENGMVLPLTLKPDFLKVDLVKNFSAEELIETACNNGTVSKDPKVQKLLEQFSVPPLWVLLNECAFIIKNARTSGALPVHDTKIANACLTVINVRARYWRGTPATDIVREVYLRGDLGNREEDEPYEEGAISTQALASSCSVDWEKRLAKHLYIHSPASKFILAPSTKMHGVNKYQKVNSFAHLAALNPTPPMIALYQVLLGDDYDIDQDHAVENLVQMLYRTSLRDPKAQAKVLMIVPYEAYAKMLQAKIGCQKFTFVHTPRLTPLIYSKEEDPLVRIANGRKGGLNSGQIRKSNLSPEQQKKRVTLRAMKSRYSKYIRERPMDLRVPVWLENINRIHAELDAMIKPKYDL